MSALEPSAAESSGPGERVRFCLACGAVLSFSVTRCTACGAAAAAEPPRGECPVCRAGMPAQLLFCPHCGADVGAAGLPDRTPEALPADDGGARLHTASVVLLCLAPLLVLLALVDVLLTARGH